MKKNKKLLSLVSSIVLALALCICMVVPAFAVNTPARADAKSSATEEINVKDFINEKAKAAVATMFAGGQGTKADPWQITNVSQLNAMRFRPNDHFILCNNIDMSSVSHWTPIGLFLPDMEDQEEAGEMFAWCGELNGNGKTISNFTTTSIQPMGVALFGVTAGNASIHDLTMKNCNVKGLMYVGSLVGLASGKTKLFNITLTGNNNLEGLMYVGGLVGGGSNPLNKNLTAKANVTMTAKGLIESFNAQAAGVLYGGAEGCNFLNCKVTGGSVTAMGNKVNSIGAMAGCAHQSGYVKNCSAKNVTIKVDNAVMVGGLVGASANNEGLKDSSKRTVFSGNTVKNVTIKAGAEAERIGMLVGSGFYTASTADSFAEPGAFSLTNNTVSGKITGGKYVGAVTGYKGRNSVVKNNKFSVTWNGKKLTKAVGADTKSVPISKL